MPSLPRLTCLSLPRLCSTQAFPHILTLLLPWQVAVLLSAAHADFTPATADAALDDSSRLAVDQVVTGATFHRRASKAYAAALAAALEDGVNVRVPPVTGATASRRLGAEVAAVAAAGSMRHVVLRSSMGVGALRTITGADKATGDEDVVDEEELQMASVAITRMGGAATIAAQADAESALRTRCAQGSASCTVLRLGALVDSAGGIPLSFGASDALLLERVADERAKEPPLISRNDAARLVAEIVCAGLPSLADATVDAAWDVKWGMSSAGREETARTAARQKLVAEAAAAAAK